MGLGFANSYTKKHQGRLRLGLGHVRVLLIASTGWLEAGTQEAKG